VNLTWPRATLFAASFFSLVDSQIIPRQSDPGPHGEVMLFFILGYKAASKREPPLMVVALGVLLVIFIAAVNHGYLRCMDFLCVSLVILVLILILFWRRLTGDRPSVESGPE